MFLGNTHIDGALRKLLLKNTNASALSHSRRNSYYAFISAIGDKMFKAADRLKDSLKYLLVPGVLFEEFGFKYYGPVNGHDLSALCKKVE